MGDVEEGASLNSVTCKQFWRYDNDKMVLSEGVHCIVLDQSVWCSGCRSVSQPLCYHRLVGHHLTSQ